MTDTPENTIDLDNEAIITARKTTGPLTLSIHSSNETIDLCLSSSVSEDSDCVCIQQVYTVEDDLDATVPMKEDEEDGKEQLPLVRRISSLGISNENQSPPAEDRIDADATISSDLSWFADNGHLIEHVQKLAVLDHQKGQTKQSSVHFDSLMEEVTDENVSTMLPLDIIAFLRSSMDSSCNHFKPQRTVLRELFNRIALGKQFEEGSAVRSAAFDFLRMAIRCWPPSSLDTRKHWLFVLSEISEIEQQNKNKGMPNKSKDFSQLCTEFCQRFSLWMSAREPSLNLLIFLAELLELDMASRHSSTDLSSAALESRTLASIAVIGAEKLTGALWLEQMARVKAIVAHIMHSKSAPIRSVCSRLLVLCFEAQRLALGGSVHFSDMATIPPGLRQNTEQLAAVFASDQSKATNCWLPLSWLRRLIAEVQNGQNSLEEGDAA